MATMRLPRLISSLIDSDPKTPAVNSNEIATVSLNKDFFDGARTRRVLHDIDLRISTQALSMIVGPSGCGKTTLVSIIAGLLTPTSGEVHVLGMSLGPLSANQLASFRLRTVGFVFQQYNLLTALSAVDNTAVPLVAAGLPWSKARVHALNVLRRLGLADYAHALPSTLSGGQQQRVAIARALVHDPRLVICDEPTAALDAASGRQVMTLLREIAVTPNRACIVVTHDQRVYDLADVMITMEDGRITHAGRPPAATPLPASSAPL